MGVKVTFLREASDRRRGEPAARPVTLGAEGARSRSTDDQTYARSSSTRRRRRAARGERQAEATATASKVLAGLRAGERVVVSPPATRPPERTWSKNASAQRK